MRRRTKLIAMGLCLAIGASALVACGGDGAIDWDAGEWKVPEASHWIAGTLKGYDNSLENSGWGGSSETAVPTERLFAQNTQNENLYKLTLNLYKGDEFKIRYGDLGWTDAGAVGNLGANNSLDTTVADETNGIYDMTGGMGGSNFGVAADGQYELRINATGSNIVVTYVRKGDAPVLVTGVELSKTTAMLNLGGNPNPATLDLTATVAPSNATDKTVTWSSSNESVATVDATGKVTAVAVGSTVITAKTSNSSITSTCVVRVLAEGVETVAVESVTIPETLNAHVGKIDLAPTVLPDDATNKTVTYSSSDETVVKIDTDAESGAQTVTALKPGTATVTATAGDKTDTCEVTVAADYYLLGSDALARFTWDTLADHEAATGYGIVLAQNATDKTKYEVTLDLHKDSELKIGMLGMGWDVSIGGAEDGASITAAGTSVEVKEAQDSKNIKVAESGKYKLTLTVTVADEQTTYALAYERTGDAEPIPTTYEYYIKGNGINNWSHNFADDYKLKPAADSATTLEYRLVVGADGVEFGLAKYLEGVRRGDGEFINNTVIGTAGDANALFTEGGGTNFKCTTAGTYTVKLNIETGKVDFYSAQ